MHRNSMEQRFEPAEGKGSLFLKGKLTLDNVTEAKTLMHDTITSVASFVLDTGSLTMIDVAGLQLICSAHRLAVLSGKTFRLENIGDYMAKAAERMGFLRNIGCLHGPGKDCLWLEGAWNSTREELPGNGTGESLMNRAGGNDLSYHIRFKPQKESLLKGADPTACLDDMRRLGESIVIANLDNVPPFEELDPKLCFVSWDIFLKSDRALESIEKKCPYAEYGSTLRITLLPQ